MTPLSARRSRRITWTVMLCAVAITITAPHVSAAQANRPVADSITDREFWRLFTTMSEEGGAFPSENFVSNEKTYQHVIPTLQRTLTPHGVYLGVGPEQNFTHIVNLEPRMAVIFDIRRQNAMLHLMYKALFELSATRTEFVARLFSRPLPSSLGRSATPAELFDAAVAAQRSDSAFDATWSAIVERLKVQHGFALADTDVVSLRHVFEAFFEAGPDISYAYRLGRPPSVTAYHVTFAQLQSLTNADSVNMGFLATEEHYQWLRVFEARNLIVPVVGDFGGPTAIRAVGDYLRQRGAVVTAFYTSNVEQYLFNGFGAEKRFYRSVATLPIDSTSSFIRAVPVGVGGVGPLPASPAVSLPANASVQLRDSAGVTIVRATSTDSTGRTSTTLFTIEKPTPSPVGAFASGIATMGAVLDAFSKGGLTTYLDVVKLTKTDGWATPRDGSVAPRPVYYGMRFSPRSPRGSLHAALLLSLPIAPLPAQSATMSGMHGMHHAAPASVSPKARHEIDSVAKAVAALGSTSAAASNGFQPRFGWIPTMGVHWVSLQKMMSGRQTNLAAPSQLMFSKINGRDSLVGAAYGYITADNDTVRPALFDGNPPWHEHPDLAPPGLNLVMLHVWFVASPDGPFAGTNPNLPFWALGLGLPDSTRIRRDSAFKSLVMRAAVALGEVADSTAILPTLKQRAEVTRAIAPHRDSVRALIPEFRAAESSRDAARWERAATKAAAQWSAMQTIYLSSAKTVAGRERIERAIATFLGEHGE